MSLPFSNLAPARTSATRWVGYRLQGKRWGEHGRMLAGKAVAVHRKRACERARLFAEDLFHRLALGELVDEFVEIADLAHHRLQCR